MPTSKTRKKKRNVDPRSAEPKRKPPSSRQYVITMFALMAFGVVFALISHVLQLFGGWGHWIGLAAIAAGFLMTTSYR
ncbi:MAG: cell division protein CrgA [Actinobacteria bacterium]|nr:cell division protein CrgA [Actinomycetota bacterium]